MGEEREPFIEIADPEISVDQIMAEIRERITQRRQALGPARQDFPTFGAAAYPGEPAGEDYDADLYYHLKRANRLYADLGVDLMLAPSPMTRVPVLGPLWAKVRREAHALVLFYLGRLAQKQLAVNRHLVSTLNRMAVQLQEQQRQIRALQSEIAALRRQRGPADEGR